MKRSQRPLPPVKIVPFDGGEPYETTGDLPFRKSVTLVARSLLGISLALHRIADAMEKRNDSY